MNMKVKLIVITILGLLITTQICSASIANYNQKFQFDYNKQIKEKSLSDFQV